MNKNLHSSPTLTDYGYGTKPKKGLILRGTLTWENGASYKGALKSIKKQIPHGYGVYFFPKNEQWATVKGLKVHKIKSYIGEFKNGNFHGKGTFRSVGDYNYKGDFKNGRFNGKGKIEYDTGESFEGIFKNDKKVKGKWLFENGDIYEGEIKNETAHGKGKGIYKKSGKTYVGQFKNGAFHGSGKWWTDKGEVCVGEFRDGGRHGRCKQTYIKGKVAGTQYIGQWKDNFKSGKGRMKYYDGAEYIGHWKNDKYDGFGILKEINGEVYKGNWSNGELTKPKK
jgi:hypothetical protein